MTLRPLEMQLVKRIQADSGAEVRVLEPNERGGRWRALATGGKLREDIEADGGAAMTALAALSSHVNTHIHDNEAA